MQSDQGQISFFRQAPVHRRRRFAAGRCVQTYNEVIGQAHVAARWLALQVPLACSTNGVPVLDYEFICIDQTKNRSSDVFLVELVGSF
jgi:hypothetical protein